jgi:hypothetical protein
MKKIIIIIAFLISTLQVFSQTLFSNSFGNLSLQTYTTSSSSVQYTTVPYIYSLINDGHKNNIGSASNPNKPFNVFELSYAGWATVYNAIENDTFLVSTSWLDTITTVDRWIITPPISNIAANTVITWLAKSPDANFPESYALYGTNLSGTLTPQNFTIGDLLFSSTAENATWTRRSVNLGSFAGQTLRFAFRNNSNNKYQIWIDDIEVINLTTSIDAAVSSIETQKYVLTNSSQTISTTITNLAASNINAVSLNYQIGNSTPQNETITFSTPIAYKQSAPAAFALPYSISTAGNYKLKTWLSSINSSVDQNHLNDTSVTYITVQASTPKKSVLVEQFVSAYDGECTDAQQKTLDLQNDSVIVVNVHSLDSLEEFNSSGIISSYKKNTATAMIDRNYFTVAGSIAVPRSYYSNLIAQRLLSLSPASVSIVNKTYNSITKQLSFTVKADFVGDVRGDLRLNAYLVENNVHGVSSDYSVNGYNQLNNFYNVPWSPYFQMGNYVSTYLSYVLNAYQFKHQNTLVYSFDGSFGNAGLIPTTGGTQGQSYQKTFTLTVPTPTSNINKYNSDNLYIVGFLAEYDTDINKRSVLNVAKAKITGNSETLGVKEFTEKSGLTIYPNPTSGKIYLNSSKTINTYEIRVIDVMGRCLLVENLNQVGSNALIDLGSLNNGVYFLNISSETGRFIEKVVIQKN